ncbi:NAD-dependent epimerase/dehydratase family protein [Sinorhizobium meliloti]|uniref:NAD-dependent epimerase/dehydratase family protein n=1 Tax=Rhizobium meliloti TaxID=382 RepID=UPI00030819B3|nr:NAD-dependent epimerase/dehydratase family protein [Sinorhizobium meliloti]MDE4552714.1 NAD-dependent epimerase/dehydratase family protein [Sinorhizobium meliloti]MDW9400898.1 NAD-dependent epimerase/dehydratase family protein [Sinorhizobium meliloti]MDX0166261.1 NAD-dependent epimerase/dehydratase family protein [Sinorhizobium meliloti]MDX0310107.1 NAD-dependent epimerase/dehydratase family protein [Sinorhizobium meliloti]RVI28256.1 NAD-dependent epimerase/dehydratase family protein [Sinor
MRNKRVLITGGAGLIGSHIADVVAREEPQEILILDNFVRGRRENLHQAASTGRVRIIEGDIRDRALLARVMDGVDVVFHQAAIRITQCAEEPRLAFDVLAGGTFDVLEAAIKANVSKVVAASSASVLGLAESFPTTEDHHPYNNRTIYGAAKVFNEGLLRSFTEMYGLNYVALRYFNVYGPRMDVHGVYTEVLIRWMERIAAGRPPIILGDGTQTLDFVHVRDIARANLLAAKSGVTDEVFNVASGTETSLKDLAQLLARIMGSSIEPQYEPARKVNAVTRRLADMRKAERLLGFKTEISLEEGLRELIGWWQRERASAGGEAA